MISDERIMGFVEGEGCFSVMIERQPSDKRPRKTGRKNKLKHAALGIRVIPTFRVTISEKDRKILDAIREYFGVGSIYTQLRKGIYQNQQDVCYYYVQGLKDLSKIVDFFKARRFYTQKYADFQKWCKVLEIMQNGGHLTKEGILAICALRDQMNPRQNKNNRLAEDIKTLLENTGNHILAHTST